MEKVRIGFLLILLGVAILGSVFLFVGYLTPKGAGLYIDTLPVSEVYLDGEKIGKTPLHITRKPGEVHIKLIPESFFQPLSAYEQKVTLVSGVETIVRKEFASNPDFESNELLSFEEIGDGESELSVITMPEGAQIQIDEKTIAVTPYKVSFVTPGQHSLKVFLDNYKEKNLTISIFEGYKLTIILKLSRMDILPQKTVTPTPMPEITSNLTIEPTLIKILSTPTGFLRVRNEPSTLGSEIGQVIPDKIYLLVSIDEKTGWYEIEYEKGKNGWISNQYGQRINESKKDTVTPTPTI